MTLAIFDLDNTLLAGDSDYEWGQFLVNKGIVDKDVYEQANNRFLEQYQQGQLDIHEFAQFAFQPLAENSLEDLLSWREVFLQEVIAPLMTSKAKDLVKYHQQQEHTLLVITATNSFITAPIVESFGIPHLIATEPKQRNGHYIAEIEGVPCFQEGKVERLKDWLIIHNKDLGGSIFYSDSHNDLPLLKMVETAVAVDPDEKLKQVAEDLKWDIISLRD
ncbi:MAG: HAD family hydrolase [Thiotrichaceae bacterium]